ncbi:GNAT family N-acetyltransferase [uncultured Cohaesibacter sp.]|uniref:GNAT family N-acetyltransferase n=1 Tax=uncultured Cohaesibacter sp. TaxID=1002546 RepID=UPI00292F5D91|nr:GNAT family N-acetyltransferase [uncultured Cohaesibacter sp.]
MRKPKANRYSRNDELADILFLIRRAFAYMDGRIDPPSSMHRLTVEDIARQCKTGEVWALGNPPEACIFLTPKSDCLYLGKMSVVEEARGRGLGRGLITLATERARAMGFPCLELQTRIELVDNHRIFEAMGFEKCGETAHPGYDHITSITMRKRID